MEKDARHRDLVEAAGGVFFPLVVDNFGVWTPSSIEVLRSIACSSTVRNGLSVGTAFHHLMERLSVQLYRYNARMILQFWALHPHLEDDWLDACTRWEVGCLESCQSCGDNEDEGHKDSGSASPSKDPCASFYQMCPMELLCATVLLAFWLSPHLMMIVLILLIALIPVPIQAQFPVPMALSLLFYWFPRLRTVVTSVFLTDFHLPPV